MLKKTNNIIQWLGFFGSFALIALVAVLIGGVTLEIFPIVVGIIFVIVMTIKTPKKDRKRIFSARYSVRGVTVTNDTRYALWVMIICICYFFSFFWTVLIHRMP